MMKLKRLVSGFAALTIAASSFAAMTVTASAVEFSGGGAVMDASTGSVTTASQYTYDEVLQMMIDWGLSNDEAKETLDMLLGEGASLDDIVATYFGDEYDASVYAPPGLTYYAKIEIPKLDGVTYYFTDDGTSSPLDQLCEWMEDSTNNAWMKDSGINLTRYDNTYTFEVGTFEGRGAYKKANLTIDYQIDPSKVKEINVPETAGEYIKGIRNYPNGNMGSIEIPLSSIQNNQSVTAILNITAVQPQYKFSISKPTGGTVTIAPTENVNVNGTTADVNAGSKVTFTVTPPAGYEPDITGNANIAQEAGSYTYTCIPTADTNLSISWHKTMNLVTLIKANAGDNITMQIDDDQKPENGTFLKQTPISAYVKGTGTFTFDVTVPAGYTPVSTSAAVSFEPATGDNSGNKYVGTVQIAQITKDTDIAVSLAKKVYNVTVNENTNATVSAPATVEHDGILAFDVIPDENYIIKSVEVNGTKLQSTTGTSYTVRNVTSAPTITVVTELGKYNVRFSKGTPSLGYTITVNQPAETDASSYTVNGQTATVTKTASGEIGFNVTGITAGYEAYSDDSGVEINADGTGTVDLSKLNNADATITISLRKTTHTIKLDSAVTGATVSGIDTDKKNVEYGTNVDFTVAPAADYEVTVKSNGVEIHPTSGNRYSVQVVGETVITVETQIGTYDVSFSKTTSTPLYTIAIATPATEGAYTVSGNTATVNKNATDNIGFTVKVPTGYRASCDNQAVKIDESGNGTVDLSMLNKTNTNIAISLSKIQYTVKLDKTVEHANVSGLPTDGRQVDYDTDYTFTVTPHENYIVTVANGGTVITPTNGNNYTVHVTSDVIITVTSARGTYTVTDNSKIIDKGYTAQISKDGSDYADLTDENNTVQFGESARLKFVEKPGYRITGVTVNGVALNGDNSAGYVIPANTTSNIAFDVKVEEYTVVDLKEEYKETFRDNTGDPYTGYVFNIIKTHEGSDKDTFAFGLRAQYSGYDKYYKFGTVTTLGEGSAVQVGVVAPEAAKISLATSNGTLQETSAGVESQSHDVPAATAAPEE